MTLRTVKPPGRRAIEASVPARAGAAAAEQKSLIRANARSSRSGCVACGFNPLSQAVVLSLIQTDDTVAESGELRERAAVLQAQVADLAARVRQNSKNSSRPPSSDGLGKPAPKSLRAKTGRKPGRPKGQPGATMQLTDHPDHVIRHEPSCCAACSRDLDGAGEAGVERRQVTEIPPVKAEVTEHRLIGRRCICGTVTLGRAPEGVTAPVQYGPRAAALGTYLWHGQFLSRDRACAALGEMFGCAPGRAARGACGHREARRLGPVSAARVGGVAYRRGGRAPLPRARPRVGGRLRQRRRLRRGARRRGRPVARVGCGRRAAHPAVLVEVRGGRRS